MYEKKGRFRKRNKDRRWEIGGDIRRETREGKEMENNEINTKKN